MNTESEQAPTSETEGTNDVPPVLTQIMEASGLSNVGEDCELSHYASAAGLQGIVEKGAIFGTHAEFFVDLAEISYGRELAAGPILRLVTHGLGQIIAPYLQRPFASARDWEVFATCFCEDADALPQWLTFGAKGEGYSISFRSDALSRGNKAILLRVTYGEAGIARFDAAVDFMIARLEGVKTESEVVALATAFAVALFLLTLAAKKEEFSHEKEWRLIHLVDRDKVKGNQNIAFRTMNGLLVPYLTLELPRTPEKALDVTSVCCGPALSDEQTKHGLGLLLEQHGISRDLIRESSVRIRPAAR